MSKEQGRHLKPQHLSPRRPARRRFETAPFFAVMVLLTVVAFLLPLRPTESIAEKRKLAAFPAFSARALWSGSYFDDISLWFSDTFPGRERFIAVNARLEQFHGLNRNRVVDHSTSPRQRSDDLDALLESVENAAPTPAATATPAPTPTPEPTVDPNAEITEWQGQDAKKELDIYGSMMVLGDTIIVTQGFSADCSDAHARLMNEMGDAMAAIGVRFFNLPAPTSVGILLSPETLAKIDCADQGKMLRYMFAQENDHVYKVNAFNHLIAHNDEYLYYNSDHHWTALGAYYAYVAFCQAAGFTPVPLSDYEEVSMGRFVGTYYFQLSGNVDTHDELIAYVPPGDIHMAIAEYPSMTSVIVDESEENESLKYNTFIGGDNPVTVITNDSLPDAPNCVVLKDSFGNPFVIFLTQHYHKVIVLDYRNAGRTVSDAVAEYGAQDVILVQSIGVSQNSDAITQLRYLLK